MNVYGIDFTSRPKRSKPLTCLACTLERSRLTVRDLTEWREFAGFEAALRRKGPWIAGIDFPFGQARRFIEEIGWPRTWQGTIDHVATMTRPQFRTTLDGYRMNRPAGNKEHRRNTDRASGSISPQKLYGTPVGLMFFEGAPRLKASGVTIPGLQQGDPQRIVVEAYPGILARTLIGKRPYKQDAKAKQTQEQHQARKDLLRTIKQDGVGKTHGITVEAPDDLADDPGADHLDALLCAIQAAWAWTQRDNGYGQPKDTDPLEGWIADPTITG